VPGFLTACGYDYSPVKHKMKRMTVDPSQSGCGSPSKGCCAPAAAHTEAGVTAPADTAVRECPPEIRAEMVDLPGGTFLMGTDYEFGFPGDGEGPVHAVNLRPFAIDKFPVTNRRFREFVRATGYCTEAEHFGWSFVFWAHIPASKRATLIEDTVSAAPWWCKVSGAKWDAPEGPGSALEGRDNHPAVHVSWNDATAFASWSGRRLPTEAEWEYAARGGLVQKLYPWGDKLRPNGEHRCNIWQGEFPRHDTAEDGYAGTCPVDAFPPNGYGLYSTTGNTWEWCADWFSPESHRLSGVDNPAGPATGQTRVMKGGSFLCHKSYCNRYRVAARTSNTPDSSTAHMSLRCVL
jgi:sulfatase modifying factor 1